MAIFDDKSRYVQHAETYTVTDRRGREVQALGAAEPPAMTLLGEHLRKEGQRLDHLAFFYLKDADGYWRLAEINDAVLPEALAERRVVKIPTAI